jgi:hypothetical protein
MVLTMALGVDYHWVVMLETRDEWYDLGPVDGGGHMDPRRLNAIRHWCRGMLGAEHEEWSHHWTARGYAWRFRTREGRFMFQMVWQ